MKKLAHIILALLLACSPLYAQNGASGLIVNNAVNCATSNDGTMVGIGNPLAAPITATVFSGTLPAGTYYVEFSFYDFLGHETLASPEGSIVLGSSGGITVNPPTSGIPAGAAGMRIYIGVTSGSETLQGASAGDGSFTQSVPLNLTSSSPPPVNSTLCMIVSNGAVWPVGTGYNVSVADSSGNTFPGYPMEWQLATPGVQINVSNGLPYYHGVVMYPTPLLASPLNHSTQSMAGSFSTGSYPIYTGGIVAGGQPGFTGTKVFGACTVTYVGGVNVGVVGC
jgi:hypothetical protein